MDAVQCLERVARGSSIRGVAYDKDVFPKDGEAVDFIAYREFCDDWQ